MLKGIPVSPGYAIAKILKFENYTFDLSKTIVESPEQEIKRYEDAIKQSVAQLKALKKANSHKLDEETLHIFDAHIAICTDPEMIEQVKQMIRQEKCALTYALSTVVHTFVALFEQMSDEYLRSRASDLLEVKDRILKNAHQLPIIELDQIKEPVILAIHELTASQAAQIDPQYILGVLSEMGGNTSHSTIIVRQIGLPTIVGIPHLMDEIQHGQPVILDAFKGEVIVDFDSSVKSEYVQKIHCYEEQKQNLKALIGKPTILKDHVHIEMLANIGSSKDLQYLTNQQADGIGLFRTELMYLDRTSLPNEDELFEEYKKVLTFFKQQPVTIRTLDIGGDKPLPYMNFKNESNPALGSRAIRLSFLKPDIFNIQIRALLRASVYGHLNVMFPMISTLDELTHIKDSIKQCMAELDEKKVTYQPFKIGIMIEIPSAAIMADQLAAHVDFFSIGTNDLIQYTFAADRTNPDVEYLYQPFHPVISRLIKMVVDAANKHHIPVSVCGEMAGHPIGAKLLVGLGIKKLSMTPSSILPIKSSLLKLAYQTLAKKAQQALAATNEEELIKYFKDE